MTTLPTTPRVQVLNLPGNRFALVVDALGEQAVPADVVADSCAAGASALLAFPFRVDVADLEELAPLIAVHRGEATAPCAAGAGPVVDFGLVHIVDDLDVGSCGCVDCIAEDADGGPVDAAAVAADDALIDRVRAETGRTLARLREVADNAVAGAYMLWPRGVLEILDEHARTVAAAAAAETRAAGPRAA